MQSERTDTEAGRTLEVMILEGYNEYVKYNYPKDPAVYRIRMNTDTFKKLEEYLPTHVTVPPIAKKVDDTWHICGIKVVVDDRLDTGEIQLGPEQIEFKWDQILPSIRGKR